jgi:FSR family fosmidomycin resistance protein-like MFS transporter
VTAAGEAISAETGLRETLRTNTRARFWSVLFGHFTIDMFSSMGSVLMAFLSVHLIPMTNTQIGLAISSYQLLGALSQPFFGLQADRSGGRWLGTGGVVWSITMMMIAVLMAALTGNYVLMVIPYVLGALGSGAFHPIGTMHAGGTHGKSHVGKLSWFFLAGQIGGATGPAITGVLLDSTATHNSAFTAGLPMYANLLVEHGSPSPLLLLSLFGIPGILLMALTLPSRHAYAETRRAAALSSAAENFRLPVVALSILAVTIMLRSFSNPGMVAFLPRLFQEKGWSAAEYGFVTSMFWLSSGIAGVIFGNLAQKYSAKMITALSLLASAPMIFLLPNTNGAAAIALVLLGGGLSGGSHSLLVAMSQRLLPKSRGFASGAVLGFIFGTGAIGTLIIGGLSDSIGLGNAFQIVSVVMVITGLLSFALREA